MLSDKARNNLQEMHEQNHNLLENSTTLKVIEQKYPAIYKDIIDAINIFDEHIMNVLDTEKITTDKIMMEKLAHIQQEGKQIETMMLVTSKMLVDKKNEENGKNGRN